MGRREERDVSQEEDTGSMYSPEPEDDQALEQTVETVQAAVGDDTVVEDGVLQEAAARLHLDVANLQRAARADDDSTAEREIMTELLLQGFKAAVGQTMEKAPEELRDVVSDSRRATAMMRDEHDRTQQRSLQAMESMKAGIRQEMKDWMEKSQDREHDMAQELKHQMRKELLEATRSLTTQAGENEERITRQLRETMRLVQEGQEGVRDGLEKVTQRQDTSQREMRRKINDVEGSLRQVGGEFRSVVELRTQSNSRERLREESINTVTMDPSLMQSRTSRPSVRMSNAPPTVHESTRWSRPHRSTSRGQGESEEERDMTPPPPIRRTSTTPAGFGQPFWPNATMGLQAPKMHQASGIPRYYDVQRSGYINDSLDTVNQACEAFGWNESQKKLTLITNLDTPVKHHLRTYCNVAHRSHGEMCAVLRRRYGADREREFSRNSFQLNRQNKGESAEDFLDRLIRAHKIGWSTCEPEMRKREVLSTLMHEFLDTRLSNTLVIEYQKPMNQMRPPRMGQVRAYFRRMENSRELRRRKQEMGMYGTPLGQRAEQQPLKDYLNPAGMPSQTLTNRFLLASKDRIFLDESLNVGLVARRGTWRGNAPTTGRRRHL